MATMPRGNANDDVAVAIKMEQDTTLQQETEKDGKKKKQHRHPESSSTAAVKNAFVFPPNCPVVYYNESSSLVAMGTVVSFDSNANRYTITALNQVLDNVLPSQLSFAPRCPVWVLPWKRALKWKRAKILGSYQKDSESFYSVEEETSSKTLVHHGIPLERIRYDNGNDDVFDNNEDSTKPPRTEDSEGPMEIEASIMEPTAKEATHRNGSSLTQTEESVDTFRVPPQPNRLRGSIQAPEMEEESLQALPAGAENASKEEAPQEIPCTKLRSEESMEVYVAATKLLKSLPSRSRSSAKPSGRAKDPNQGVAVATTRRVSMDTSPTVISTTTENTSAGPAAADAGMQRVIMEEVGRENGTDRSPGLSSSLGKKDPNHGAVAVASTTTTRRVSMDTTVVSTASDNVQNPHPKEIVNPAEAAAADAATRRVSMELGGRENPASTNRTTLLPQGPKVLPATACPEEDPLTKSNVTVARRSSVSIERSSSSGYTIQQGRVISPFARDKSSEGNILSPVSSKIPRKGTSPKGATVSSSPSSSVRTTSSIVRLLQKANASSFPPPPPLVGNDDRNACNRGTSQNESTTAALSPVNSKIPRKLASPASTTSTILSPMDGKVPRKGASPKGASNRVTFSPSAESPTTTLCILNSLRQGKDQTVPPPPPLVGADEHLGDPDKTTSPEAMQEKFTEQPTTNSCSPDRFMQAACEVSSENATLMNEAEAPARIVSPDKEQDLQDSINDSTSASLKKRPYSDNVNEGVAACEQFTSPPPKRIRADPHVRPQQSNCSRMSHGGMFRYMLLPSWLDQSLLGESIIGIGGKTHKELQQRFNCGIGLQTSKTPWRIKVKFDSESGEQHMRAVLFELESIVLTAVPKTELPLLLYELAHMNGYGDRFGNMVRQRAPWNPNSTTCEAWMCRVPFPSHFRKQLSGIFIGKKGVGLSRIYKETGCNISIPAPGEPCCIVAGVDPQLVQKTVAMVQDQLRWAERVYEEIQQKHALLAQAE